MHFQQFAPPPHLQAYVRYFWALESTGQGPAPATFRTLADGCPGLVYQQPTLFRTPREKPWPRLFLYGQSTKPTEIYADGPFKALGVYLYPSALHTVFGLNAEVLTDGCVDLALLAGPQDCRLFEQLESEATTAARVELLAAYLGGEVSRRQGRADGDVQLALARLSASGGRASLPALRQELRLSERSFQRRFKESVGIPPKLFANICRFQASLGQLRRGEYGKLSDIAFEHDYADQSHYIRAFREFTGLAPYQFRQRSNEVVENFPELRG